MNQIGYIALLVAFVMALYAVFALSLGAWKGYYELLRSGRTAAWAVPGLVTLGTASVIYALLTDDFGLHYVAHVSARAMEWYYKVGALWGGQEGSLLLWAFILSIVTFFVLFNTRKGVTRQLGPWVLVVMMSAIAFFLAMCTIVANVFEQSAIIPQDGSGLNPQLQNPGMLIHPLMLYSGYVSTIAAAGFAFSALITKRLDNTWVRLSRRWILTSWVFLTVGNFLGGQWAYVELGWGGYWAWDPVENAAIMPWFITTALLHSIMIQQRRGMFKIWNLSLAFIAYALSLFGTFLTRSGVLSSVHAFGESTLGPYFMVWIAFILIVGFGLIFMRMPYLKSENKLDSVLSRESSFLVNNILFFLVVAFMLWGTLSPLISQITTGVKNEVTADYFVRSVVPVLLGIIFLMGIGPFIAWRKASLDSITKSFWIPASVGLGGAFILFGIGIHAFVALLGFGVALFTGTTVVLDWVRGIRTRQRHTDGKIVPAVQQMVRRNPSRYGGMLVHLGIVIITIVIVASSVFKVTTVTVHTLDGKTAEVDTRNGAAIMEIGETFVVKNVHNYEARLDSIDAVGSPLKMTFTANFTVLKDGVRQPPVKVASELFLSNQMPNTVVYIGVDPMEDFYISMPLNGVQAKKDAQGNPAQNAAGFPILESAAFQVFVNPLMMWAWLGLAITLLGLMVTIWPDPQAALKPLPAWERVGVEQPQKETVQV